METTTLVPGYPAVLEALAGGTEVQVFENLFDGPATVRSGSVAGLADVLALDAPHLFARHGSPYFGPDGRPWQDNDLRFAALGATGAALAVGLGFDVLHAHDWRPRSPLPTCMCMTAHGREAC